MTPRPRTLLRAGTWNLNYRGETAAGALGALVSSRGLDLVMLQEVNPRLLPTFLEAAGLDWAVTAFDAGAPAVTSSGRRRTCAIAGTGEKPTIIGADAHMPVPERFIFARIEGESGPLTVASYHAPPGVTWGVRKVQQAHRLLEWIQRQSGPLVLGADANTPLIDHPDPALVRTHWHSGRRKLAGLAGDDVVFGGAPSHHLRDALRVWLDQHPSELARIRAERPEGPLATSHVTGRRRERAGNPRRFDALWVSPELVVSQVHYEMAMAGQAGTDHALVTAELESVRALGGPSQRSQLQPLPSRLSRSPIR